MTADNKISKHNMDRTELPELPKYSKQTEQPERVGSTRTLRRPAAVTGAALLLVLALVLALLATGAGYGLDGHALPTKTPFELEDIMATSQPQFGPPHEQYEAVVPTPSNVQPGMMLDFNLQNYTLITDTEHDWYTASRPTQKGLYQLAAEYVPGEGVVFTYAKSNAAPDPMIYLPVYDLCYNINIKNYPYVAICYKSSSTNASGVFYFATATNGGLKEGKTFNVSLPQSEDWNIAVGRAGRNGNWTGRLTELRFDISSGEFSGQYTVKWIGFFKSEAEAAAYGVNGVNGANIITPSKGAYSRGEPISFTVSSSGKGDWVVLVQEGDACYADSTHDNDLYISKCMPLYYTAVENGGGTIDIDLSGGIYHGELLPAGRYDLVYLPRGRFAETSRSTITITEDVVRTPLTEEIIYVTRGPDPTDTPEPTATEVPVETQEPTPTEGRHRITPAPTEPPVDKTPGRVGLAVAIAAALIAGGVLTAFFLARRKRLQRSGHNNSPAGNGGSSENHAGTGGNGSSDSSVGTVGNGSSDSSVGTNGSGTGA